MKINIVIPKEKHGTKVKYIVFISAKSNITMFEDYNQPQLPSIMLIMHLTVFNTNKQVKGAH